MESVRIFSDTGKVAHGSEAHEQPGGGAGNQQGGRASHDGEQSIFDEELSHEAGTADAEGLADGDLTAAAGAAGQKQVGDIGAGDEQNHSDYAHQEHDHGGEHAAAAIPPDGNELGAGIVFRMGELARELRGDGGELGLGLPRRDTGGEAGVAAQPVVAPREAARAIHRLAHGGRQVHLEGESEDGALETFGGDADDGEVAIVQADLAADQIRVGGESLLPEAMAHHDDRVPSGIFVLFRLEEAAGGGLNSEGTEIVGGDEHPPDALGTRSFTHADGAHAGDADAGDCARAAPGIDVIGPGEGDLTAVGAVPADGHQAARIDCGQGIEDHGIEPAEDGGIGPDSEGESENRGERKSWAFAQLTHAVAYIGAQAVEAHIHLREGRIRWDSAPSSGILGNSGTGG